MSTIRTKQYELTFVLGEAASSKEGTAKTTWAESFIAQHKGTVSKVEAWGRRELAYPIGKNRSGYYVTLWFEAPTTIITPLEQALRFDEEVIRFLTTTAYTSAQPGTLYPVVEEKPEKEMKEKKVKDGLTEEQMLRSTAHTAEETADDTTEITEEERLEKLDAALDDLLKDETSEEK
jgi:ribosomal protein S6